MCLVGLKHVATAEGAEDAEYRKQYRQEPAARQSALSEALGQVIHRATGDGAVFVFVAIFHAEGTFGKFRSHAHESRKNHPEGCTGPADANRDRDAGDVTQADGSGKRGCQSLEVADLTRVVRIGVVTFDQ